MPIILVQWSEDKEIAVASTIGKRLVGDCLRNKSNVDQDTQHPPTASMYACTCMCVYVYTYICMHVYVYMYACTCIFMYVHVVYRQVKET